MNTVDCYTYSDPQGYAEIDKATDPWNNFIYQSDACSNDGDCWTDSSKTTLLNNANGEVFPIYANRTILSTGGIGQLYLHTTIIHIYWSLK